MNIDPRDMRTHIIEKLFYYQVQNLTMKTAKIDRMQLFDFQFSDQWTRGDIYDMEI